MPYSVAIGQATSPYEARNDLIDRVGEYESKGYSPLPGSFQALQWKRGDGNMEFVLLQAMYKTNPEVLTAIQQQQNR